MAAPCGTFGSYGWRHPELAKSLSRAKKSGVWRTDFYPGTTSVSAMSLRTEALRGDEQIIQRTNVRAWQIPSFRFIFAYIGSIKS
jgi:hypothetical protein